MEHTTENLNSLKEEVKTLEEELTTLDSETDKEKISEITEKVNSLNDEIKTLDIDDSDDDIDSVRETNKRLYARAKKAEGFILEGDKWVKKPKPASEKKPEPTKPVADEATINRVLDKRELESLEISDSLKKEVEIYAKVQGISIKKALNSEYISFLKEKDEKKQKIDDASLGSGRKSTKKNYSEMSASDFDLKTTEGKAEFAKYEQHLRDELG